ncbi:MAG: pilus assembly PilX N-terminal domain-containing protein [Candidatus Omnitrophica bacterium]|nr:pilus assembly PilX N-terminal domain-containing protein [Candidatus Omnitrophota bacterium]
MKLLQSEKGVALVIVVIFAILGTILGGITLQIAVSESRNAQHQVDSTAALYLAEAGIQRALGELKKLTDEENLPNEEITIEDFKLDAVGTAGENFLGNNDIEVTITPGSGTLVYYAQASASVRSATKTIYATLVAGLPSGVFDYVYFINNWGWFYGNGIMARGDVRSNGRFDFKFNPTVNGEIYAVNEVETNDGDIRGWAGQEDENGDFPYQHPSSSTLPMPNLQDLSIYEELAIENGSTVSIGGNVLIDGVYGDDASESGNIVLVGTVQDPIEINGPVVVTGDVVIKGKITGQGVIYSGRNIYIADEVSYTVSPGASQPNENAEETWYEVNKDKDLVGYAAQENIIFGDYTSTTGGTWDADAYLFDMGTEDVGVDGIWGTEDEGENDGEFDAEHEDLDGDGVMDDFYTWDDVYTSVPISDFDNCPAGVSNFGDIARNGLQQLDGIFYTNHAITGRVGNLVLYGSLIGKDDGMVYSRSFNLFYDLRIHSKWHKDNLDWFINLGFPVAVDWEIFEWRE